MMKRHSVLASGLIATTFALAPNVVAAHPVGEPQTPTCFGERISHGSSDPELTPAERAAILQGLDDESPPEEQAFFDELLSIKTGKFNAGVMTRWVRFNCAGGFEG